MSVAAANYFPEFRSLLVRTHLVIPDTQVKPGVPLDHLDWIGRYIVEQFWGDDLVVIHLGDHWDMPSLSSYDHGKRQMEGRRYLMDIDAGNQGIERLDAPLNKRNAREARLHQRQWWPERHLLRGNHEDRVTRAIDLEPKLDGVLSLDHMLSPGWIVHPFLERVDLDGVWYSHYFYNPMTGNPWGGTIDNRLQKVGHSFVMGHQQTLLHGTRYVGDQQQHGIVAGACYLHEEDYKGPQGNAHWRGIVVLHQVEDGEFDPMFVSLDYLARRYEGMRLNEFIETRTMGDE